MLKSFLIIAFCLVTLSLTAQSEKHRLIILADMGNEPDEVQQMVHMMMYSNEFDLEGLIAVTGKYLNPQQQLPYRQVLHPELFHEIIDGYEQVRPNLLQHADGWPQVDYLHGIVANGQTEYGIDGTGPGKSTEGSNMLIESMLNDDPRLLYIVVNAGSNTLAQALIDFETDHSEPELNQIIAKLRIFENGAQDNAGAWICAKFPDIHWVRSNFQTYCYGGPSWDSNEGREGSSTRLGPYTWEPYDYSAIGQHHWTLTHVIGDHGRLGMVYPLRQTHSGRIVYLEGGGTIPWLGLVHRGLSDPNHPNWGGWSGRYSVEKVKNAWSRHQDVKADEQHYDDFAVFVDVADQWTDPETNHQYNNTYTPVWRWRRAFFNDFKCRMDWCVSTFEEANHNPIAAVDGNTKKEIYFKTLTAGDSYSFDASGSEDPDGDGLHFDCWYYPEAGNYQGTIVISETATGKFEIQVPDDASGAELHLVLEVKDDNEIASMYDYRRIVLTVK